MHHVSELSWSLAKHLKSLIFFLSYLKRKWKKVLFAFNLVYGSDASRDDIFICILQYGFLMCRSDPPPSSLFVPLVYLAGATVGVESSVNTWEDFKNTSHNCKKKCNTYIVHMFHYDAFHSERRNKIFILQIEIVSQAPKTTNGGKGEIFTASQ